MSDGRGDRVDPIRPEALFLPRTQPLDITAYLQQLSDDADAPEHATGQDTQD